MNESEKFRRRLTQKTGISDSAISAAWPEWWSTVADASPSAQAELRFSVARKLGLDPRSLFDEDSPHFMWDDTAKYKNFNGSLKEQSVITSFGTSISRMLLKGLITRPLLDGVSAADLRALIMRERQFVRLQDLLALLWGIGIATIHLRVYPLAAKRMCAMAVSAHDGHAILLAKDSHYPAGIAFHIAHEIGHIALGHIAQDSAVIDMKDFTEETNEYDPEEIACDRFALELLTGDPDFTIGKIGHGRNAEQLANQVIINGASLGIEPGTLALCYGHATKEWATVQAAMHFIYTEPIPAWWVTNQIASTQINWSQLGDDNTNFVHAIMGGI